MTEKNYAAVRRFFLGHDKAFLLLKIAYKYLPAVIFAAYPMLLLVLFILMLGGGSAVTFFKVLLVPAVVFVTVSAFRYLLDFPRPYERLGITPLIKKDTRGKSFPSRHTASIFIISMAYNYLNPVAGAILFVFAVLISASRYFAGVHFVRDIVAAMVYSLSLGALGFYVF